MADSAPALQITLLPPPVELPRRPQKKGSFVPPPPRNRATHAATVRSGVASVQSATASLTPEQRRAIFLKLRTANPISEDDLRRAGLFPVRQIGRYLTVALTVDASLTALAKIINTYANSGKPTPDFATLIANLEVGPESLTLEERMSDSFAASRSDLLKAPRVVVKLELGPLAPKVYSLDGFRNGVDEAFERLKSAQFQGVTIYDHIYDRDGLAVTASVGMAGSKLKELLESKDWSFIIWFDTAPRFSTVTQTLDEFRIAGKTIEPPAANAPLICVIDTGVLTTNALIQPASRAEHSKSFNSDVPDNATDEANHGTGVAGVALYQDLGGQLTSTTFTPAAWLGNARILNAKEELGDGQLFAKVLESAIRHFHGLGCRIFNLSVCDRDKPFDPRNPLDVAEMLDSLAAELDVLIVVAAGNIPLHEVNQSITDGNKYPAYLFAANCRILDPAQAINVLTVGSIAQSHKCISAHRKPFSMEGQPSPFTRCGPGINDYMKPELVDFGGNVVNDTGMNRVVEDAGCQIVTTSNDIGRLLTRVNGTSYAAPRVAHLAAIILIRLRRLALPDGKRFEPTANLLRALIVNSAEVGSDWATLFGGATGKQKFDWRKACGYGQPSAQRAIGVRDNRMILIYQGEVEIDKIVYFSIPVPAEMKEAGRKFGKRIRVAVSYTPSVRRTRTMQYAGTRMYWRLFRGDVVQDDIYAAMSVEEATEDSDLQRPKDLQGEYKFQRRSKSTVQHDVCCWKIHKAEYSTGDYTLAVVARRNWDTAAVNQKFSVAVTVEVDDPQVKIASRIMARIAALIKVRVPRVGVRRGGP